MVKHLPAMRETRVQSLGREDPLEKEMATHSSTHAWFHRWRSLVGYSTWGRKESDRLNDFTFTFISYPLSKHVLISHLHEYFHKIQNSVISFSSFKNVSLFQLTLVPLSFSVSDEKKNHLKHYSHVLCILSFLSLCFQCFPLCFVTFIICLGEIFFEFIVFAH